MTLRAIYKKETREDPESENNAYSNFALNRDTQFCCEHFKTLCKKFTVWNYEQGKFAIVNKITYEGHSVQPIDFCPFCGEKIEYEDADSAKTKKKKSKSF